MESNLLSVVIPCKNERKCIRHTLHALRLQTIITPSTPIYVADAGSTDGTLEILDEFRKHLNIQVVQGGMPAVGRNNGAKHCSTKYILFLDADIVLGQKKSLENALNLAEAEDLDLVTTSIKSTTKSWKDNILWNLHTFASRTKVLGTYATGMFIFMKREAFWNNGGFNEDIILGEDWDLTHRVPTHKFAMCETYIYTSNRRFVSNGYIKTMWQYICVACSKSYRERKHTAYFEVEYN